MLLWVRAVEARKRLHGFDARKQLINIHGVQQRLVIACLELVGDDQEAVWLFTKHFFDLAAWEAVQRGLGHILPGIFVFAGKGDDCGIWAFTLAQIALEGVEVLDGPRNPARYHHRPRLSTDFTPRNHLLVEVIDHDFGLLPDRVVVAFDIAANLFARPVAVEFGVILDLFGNVVVTVDWRVALQYIQDEAFLNRLLHGVAVKGPVLDLPAIRR